jgi:hypothetical protein
MRQIKYLPLLFMVFLMPLCFQTASLFAAGPLQLTKGQTVYIPAYSHIYHGNREVPLLLSVTLSIRNTDPTNSLTVTAVNYHETDGSLLKEYIKEPLVLSPLGTNRYIVAERDSSGGSGANFIVKWHSEKPITPPIMETVMISTQSQLGISFTSRGQAIVQQDE